MRGGGWPRHSLLVEVSRLAQGVVNTMAEKVADVMQARHGPRIIKPYICIIPTWRRAA